MENLESCGIIYLLISSSRPGKSWESDILLENRKAKRSKVGNKQTTWKTGYNFSNKMN